MAGFGPNNASHQAFELAHHRADTDLEPSSIHHTLGKGPTQASPGNHSHDLPVGQVKVWLAAAAPEDHLFLNGAVISKATYPDFFAAVGITADTLTLPNITGLVTRVQ